MPKSRTLDGRLLVTLTAGKYTQVELSLIREEAAEHYRSLGLGHLKVMQTECGSELHIYLRGQWPRGSDQKAEVSESMNAHAIDRMDAPMAGMLNPLRTGRNIALAMTALCALGATTPKAQASRGEMDNATKTIASSGAAKNSDDGKGSIGAAVGGGLVTFAGIITVVAWGFRKDRE